MLDGLRGVLTPLFQDHKQKISHENAGSKPVGKKSERFWLHVLAGQGILNVSEANSNRRRGGNPGGLPGAGILGAKRRGPLFDNSICSPSLSADDAWQVEDPAVPRRCK